MVSEMANGALGRGAVATDNDHAGERIEGLPTSATESAQAAIFDYSTLDASAREIARAAAFHIRARLGSIQKSIVEVGERLIAVKAALGHGHFGRWIGAELGMSDDSAERFMNVARRLPDIPHGAEFAPSVLYALAAPSTPDSVVRIALDRARAGETIIRDDIKALKEIAADPLGRRALIRPTRMSLLRNQTPRSPHGQIAYARRAKKT